MKTWLLSVLFCLFASAVKAEETVFIVPLTGQLDATWAALIERSIKEAHSKNAKAIVFEIDTGGGLAIEMFNIGRILNEEKTIKTVAYVHPIAYSAGSYVALACNKIYMSPTASMGASTPVIQGPQGITSISEDEDVKRKQYSAFRSSFRAVAESQGRNALLAEGFVEDPELWIQKIRIDGEIKILKGEEVDELVQAGQKVEVLETIKRKGEGPLSLTAQAAFSYNLIDGIADSREQVLQLLALERANVFVLQPTWSEDFVRLLNQLAPLLLVLGFVLAFVEFKIPGFGIWGILSITCFVLLFFGNYLIGLAQWAHIIAFALGIGLIGVEIFLLPGTVVFGALGFLCVAYGLVFSFTGFYWPSQETEYEMLRSTGRMFFYSLLSILIAILVLALVIAKYLHKIPFFGKRLVMEENSGAYTGDAAPITTWAQQSLMGKIGRATTDLRPAGRIEIEASILDAQSDGAFIEKGSSVRVVEVSTNRIIVSKEGS